MRISMHKRGFTLIEVMIAILVFMVSLMGLVALQRASISGTAKGREHTAGANLARFVMNWVQADAASFPLSQTVASAVDTPVLAQGLNNDNAWLQLPDGEGIRFDAYLGNNTEAVYEEDINPPTYCAYYRVHQFTAGTVAVGDSPFIPEVYKVTVMVNWPRWRQHWEDWRDCSERPPISVGASEKLNLASWESVEMTSVVTREYTSDFDV